MSITAYHLYETRLFFDQFCIIDPPGKGEAKPLFASLGDEHFIRIVCVCLIKQILVVVSGRSAVDHYLRDFQGLLQGVRYFVPKL